MFCRSLLIAMSLLGATAASAKVITLDYDRFDYPEAGEPFPDICATESHLNYCASNTYDYGHFAPYAFLSDYDYTSREIFTVDAGYSFTPKRFDILFANSYVRRLYCPDGACVEDISDLYYPGTYEGKFEPYDYSYLSLQGYRNGDLVALKVLDPTDKTKLRFGRDFRNIDRLEVELLGSYFETVEIEDDGYAYTCIFNTYQYCNEMGFDNFRLKVSKIKHPGSPGEMEDPAVAAMPLPAPVFGLLAALAALAGISPRRRA